MTGSKGPLDIIEGETLNRYQERFKEHGVSPLALVGVPKSIKRIRFDALIDLVGVDRVPKCSVLDYGCGFADLFGHLKRLDLSPRQYTGVDLNPGFVAVAQDRYPDAEFIAKSPNQSLDLQGPFDLVVVLGVLNYKRQRIANLDYSRAVISTLWPMAKATLVVDFLSTARTSDYPAEDWVYYHDPADVFRLALDISPRILLKHNYAPIPQTEMMLRIDRV